MAFKFLKTGAESTQLAQKAAVEAEQRKEQTGKLFRFWLREKEEALITFVDGELGAQGYLEPPRFYEHNLFLNGVWNNYFVCPERTNPDSGDKCPLCESPDGRAYLVALFTVIDHREFKSKDGTKTYKDTKRLLVAKPQSFELLNKLAVELGGLAGQKFKVSRVGDKAASIGSLFIPLKKSPIKELQGLYTTEVIDPKTNTKSKVTYFTPADYEKEITYRTGEELCKLGLGKPAAGAAAMAPGGTTPGKAVDYSNQL